MRLVDASALIEGGDAGISRSARLADIDPRLHSLAMSRPPGEKAANRRAGDRGRDDDAKRDRLCSVEDHATPLIFSSVRTPKVAPPYSSTWTR